LGLRRKKVRKNPNRWLILFVLFLARTAMGFQFQSVASVSPLLVDELAIDFALLGALIGAWMLPGVIVAIPSGILGQRFGDKRVVLFGLALMVAGSTVVASADSYTLAVDGRVISGAGAVLLNVLLTKMVADWFADRELATAMGILVVSWPLGIGLALILLGPLSVCSSWSFAIQMTAWVCAAALICVAVIYRRPNTATGSDRAPGLSWQLSRRELTLICLAGLIWTLYNVGYIVVVSFSPVLLAERGFSAASAAIVASFATWPLIATIPIGGVLADRTGRGQVIMVGCFIVVALIMPFMFTAPSPLIVLAIIGILTGPAAGIIMALPARVLRPESRHLGMGIFFTLYYLGMALLPGIAGWFRDLTGIDTAPLLFGSALLLIAAGCAVLFRRLEARSATVLP
jgi:predicted MFS family arabinose efflux permease